MARCVLPEVVLTLGTVPTVEYATTGTQDLASRVGQFIGSDTKLMLNVQTIAESLNTTVEKVGGVFQSAPVGDEGIDGYGAFSDHPDRFGKLAGTAA